MTSWKALVSSSIIYLEIVMIQGMYIEIVQLFDINDISGNWSDRLQYLDRFGVDWHSSKSIQELPGIADNALVVLDCCIQSYRQCLFLWSHEGTDYIDRLRPQLISVRLICDGTVSALVHDHVSLWERNNDSLSVGQSLRQAIRTLLVRIVCLSRRQPLRLSEQLPRLMSLNIDCIYVAKAFSVVISLNSDDCDNLALSAWITQCDEIYNSHNYCLNIVQVLGLRYLGYSAELDCDCNIETFLCVQDCPNHRACDVFTIGSPKDTQASRLTSIGLPSLTVRKSIDARPSHCCTTLGEHFTRRILTMVHRCQDRFIESVIQLTIARIVRCVRLCGIQIVSTTFVKSCSDIFMTQDCDLIEHVIASDALSDVVTGIARFTPLENIGIARFTSLENIGHISHINKIARHCSFLQYLDILSHVIVGDCACFGHVDNFRHLGLIVLTFRLVHTSSLLVDQIDFCTDDSVLVLTLPAFVIEIRSHVGLFVHEDVTSIAVITKIVTLGMICHDRSTLLQLSQLVIDDCAYRHDLRTIEEFRSHCHMLSVTNCREEAIYCLKHRVTDPKGLIPLIAVIDSCIEFLFANMKRKAQLQGWERAGKRNFSSESPTAIYEVSAWGKSHVQQANLHESKFLCSHK
eukprot:s7894_g5.t1